jgi:Ca2+-binding EF-hand superfamily protein
MKRTRLLLLLRRIVILLCAGPAVYAQQPETAGRARPIGLGDLPRFGEMLDRTWARRPEWGDLLVAILNDQPMHVGAGWWRPASTRYDWNWLREAFDADGNARIDQAELARSGASGEKWFSRLDKDCDGELSEADFTAGESNTSAADAHAKRLFTRLDGDSNGRVSAEEFKALFQQADSDHLGFLTIDDVRSLLSDPASSTSSSPSSSSGAPQQVVMLQRLFTSQLGWFGEGPQFGEQAPDFTLPTQNGSATITLSHCRGTKPVVLIFGSFT